MTSRRYIAAGIGALLLCAGAAFAQGDSKGGAGMGPKALVVYYSRTGNTERVAKDIAARLGADIERITDTKDRTGFFGAIGAGRDAMFGNSTVIAPPVHDPAGYDIVIVGTPIWAGNMTPAVRTYLTAHRGTMKKEAYFMTSGGKTPEKAVGRMESITGRKAVASVGLDEKTLKKPDAYRAQLDAFIAAVEKGTAAR